MPQLMMFSNTARTVESAANDMNRKNRLPHRRPIAILAKNVGQGDEDEAGAAGLVHTVSEAGREDDEAGGDGDEGIQHHDANALAQQGVLFADVAAEDSRPRCPATG